MGAGALRLVVCRVVSVHTVVAVVRRRAVVSADGLYRYRLERVWNGSLLTARLLRVCMLNPSTADAQVDDATVRWLIGYAKRHGYDGIVIVNLAAYRATSPADLLQAERPYGVENRGYIMATVYGKDVVCAWGANGPKLEKYDEIVQDIIAHARSVSCFGLTKAGIPRHPLRMSHDTALTAWKG